MSTNLESRVEALEATLAFQERTIEELSQVVTDQFRQIEALKRELLRFGAQLAEMETHPALAPLREPPPPHY